MQEEDTKKLLKAKTELARFLQQTVGEVAKDVRQNRTGATAADAKALYTFLKDVRAGRDVSNKDIMQFATLFNDELTLDNLDRVHLVTLCQVCSQSRKSSLDVAIHTTAHAFAQLRCCNSVATKPCRASMFMHQVQHVCSSWV